MLKISALVLAAAAAVAVPTLIPASPAVTDFSTLPPDPFQMEQTLAAAKVDAATAAKMAADKVNGSVSAVVASTTPEGVRYAVTAFSDGKRHDMVIADDGRIMTDSVVPRFPGDEVGDAEMVTLPSGLMYYDLVEGDGAMPPDPSAQVSVHYSGWLTDGTKFDSSVDRGEPTTFPLNRVIAGWTEGVQLMSVGEERRFWIPQELAYKGRPGAPAGMLVFDVELLSIK